MTDFLLRYDRGKRRVVQIDEFSDRGWALAAYREAENQNSDDERFEIVLLQAKNREDLKQTHSHYFELRNAFFAQLAN